MTVTRIRLATATALLAVAATSAACGGGEPAAGAQREASEQVALIRSALSDADAAARRYGQGHLGHYLKLRKKQLEKEGLEMPATVSLEVRARHTSYCLRATNEGLPSIHPWATATIGSRGGGPSPSDRCGT